MNDLTPEERDAPIYSTFGELHKNGFTLDTPTWVFVLGIHIAAVVLGAWAIFRGASGLGNDCRRLGTGSFPLRVLVYHPI